MSYHVQSGAGGRTFAGGASGLGGLVADAKYCWDKVNLCEPGAGDALHMQILSLQQAITQAKTAAAAGDPNAANAVLSFQAQLRGVQGECDARATACASYLANVGALLEKYGCDATKGPFCEGLQELVNEKLPAAEQIAVTGVWDKPTCAAWWKVFGRMPTLSDVRASMDDSVAKMFAYARVCGAPDAFRVTLPTCSNPYYKPVVDPDVPVITKCPTGSTYDAARNTCVPITIPIDVPPSKKPGVSTAWILGGLAAAAAVTAGVMVFSKKGSH
jgi:hypothetical protein